MTRAQIVRRVLFAIFLLLVVMILSGIFMSIIFSSNPDLAKMSWAGGFFNQLGFLIFSFILILILGKGNLKEYGFKLPKSLNWKVFTLSILLGLTAVFLQSILGGNGMEFIGDTSLLQKIGFMWIFASVSEEVFYRGLLQTTLKPIKDRGIRIFKLFLSLPVITAALLFSGVHSFLLTMGVDIITVSLILTFALILGLIAGVQRERTGSLIPAIIVHMCFNIGGSLPSLFNN
ncbi:CPBP family intramembrane metalloprotease [Candidatus Dependentiae bacterium]|nr:CPBP family intramembrane metalloprotease [Candidatus Dependentiae bacterium]